MRFSPGLKAYLLALVLILAAVAACYYHTIDYPFLNWDDYGLIRDNPHNKSLEWSSLRNLLNPLVTGSVKILRDFSYALDFHFWGESTVGFHLVNLILYVITCLLVFSFLREFLGTGTAALIGALFFALHPTHVESVTWLTARKEPLCAVFFLASFLIYIRHARVGMPRRRRYWALAFVLFLLALISKETTVVLPAMLVAYEVAFGPRTPTPPRLLRRCLSIIPFFVVSLLFTAFVIYVSQQNGVLKSAHGGNFTTNMLSALVGPFEGLRLLFFPVDLSARYVNIYVNDPFSPPIILAGLCLIGLALVIWDNWKHSRIVSFAIGWYFLALAPVCNVIPISTLIADRYFFLPSIAVALVVGLGAQKALAWAARPHARRAWRRSLVVCPTLAILGLLGVLSHQRNYIWKDNHTLWGNVVEQEPMNVIGHIAYGNIARGAREYESAIASFRRALWLNPGMPEAHRALGDLYLLTDNVDRAILHYNQALTGSDEDLDLYLNLGYFFNEKERPGEAHEQFLKALKLDNTNVTAKFGLIDAYARGGLVEVATRAYATMSSADDPREDHAVLRNIGLAFLKLGDYEQALRWFGRALEQEPEDPESYLGMGRAHRELGEVEEARAAYEQALELDPGYVKALTNLGQLQYLEGNVPAAIENYCLALEEEPDNHAVNNNLAMAYYAEGKVELALELLREAADRAEPYVSALVNLASIHLEEHDYEAAKPYLERAVDLEPQNVAAQFNYAFCLAYLGEMDKAFNAFVYALRLGFADQEEIDLFLQIADTHNDVRFRQAWEEAGRELRITDYEDCRVGTAHRRWRAP